MGPAVLFTFYRNAATCEQRLLHLRRLNPDVPVHGLYTGEPEDFPAFAALEAHLDSCWQHPPRSPEWLWSNYDLVISRWFEEVGQSLPFDYLVVHSWDLLLLDPLHHFVSHLEVDEVLLPGLRPLEQMDERQMDPLRPAEAQRWTWLREPEFLEFLAYWQKHYGGRLWCEVSPFGALGREVCRRYAAACPPVPGHNEYRFPSLAAALGARLQQGGFGPEFWKLYESRRAPWTLQQVRQLAAQPPGQRLCHPFYYPATLTELGYSDD